MIKLHCVKYGLILLNPDNIVRISFSKRDNKVIVETIKDFNVVEETMEEIERLINGR